MANLNLATKDIHEAIQAALNVAMADLQRVAKDDRDTFVRLQVHAETLAECLRVIERAEGRARDRLRRETIRIRTS